MKKYRVYISQINQQYYDVEAKSPFSAEAKAEAQWKRNNGPTVIGVEERTPKETP